MDTNIVIFWMYRPEPTENARGEIRFITIYVPLCTAIIDIFTTSARCYDPMQGVVQLEKRWCIGQARSERVMQSNHEGGKPKAHSGTATPLSSDGSHLEVVSDRRPD